MISQYVQNVLEVFEKRLNYFHRLHFDVQLFIPPQQTDFYIKFGSFRSGYCLQVTSTSVCFLALVYILSSQGTWDWVLLLNINSGEIFCTLSSAFKVLAWVFAATTKIWTGGGSRRAHAQNLPRSPLRPSTRRGFSHIALPSAGRVWARNFNTIHFHG